MGHTYLSYANPISEIKFDEAVRVCQKQGLSEAVDIIGSGNCYLLKKFVNGACDRGLGVDLPGSSIEESLKLNSEIEYLEIDAKKFV